MGWFHTDANVRAAAAVDVHGYRSRLLVQIAKLLDANRVIVERVTIPNLDPDGRVRRNSVVGALLIGPGRGERIRLNGRLDDLAVVHDEFRERVGQAAPERIPLPAIAGSGRDLGFH